MATKKKQWTPPAHVSPDRNSDNPESLEGPGVHSGARIPASAKVKDAKDDRGKSQRRSVADRKKATYGN